MFGEVEGQGWSEPVESGLQFADAGERGLDIGQDVFWGHVLQEVGVGDDVARLIAGAAKEEGPTGSMKACEKLLHGVYAGGVQCGHIAQAKDDDVAEAVEVARGFGELFCGAEEEGAVDAQDG